MAAAAARPPERPFQIPPRGAARTRGRRERLPPGAGPGAGLPAGEGSPGRLPGEGKPTRGSLARRPQVSESASRARPPWWETLFKKHLYVVVIVYLPCCMGMLAVSRPLVRKNALNPPPSPSPKRDYIEVGEKRLVNVFTSLYNYLSLPGWLKSALLTAGLSHRTRALSENPDLSQMF